MSMETKLSLINGIESVTIHVSDSKNRFLTELFVISIIFTDNPFPDPTLGLHINNIASMAISIVPKFILVIPKTRTSTLILIIFYFLHAIPFPSLSPRGMLRVRLNDFKNVTILLNDPQNYGFHTVLHYLLFLTCHLIHLSDVENYEFNTYIG
jgi:AAA ATPase containing von Willebrand factor type A (vWA) domain